jgi:hypothetical protein
MKFDVAILGTQPVPTIVKQVQLFTLFAEEVMARVA